MEFLSYFIRLELRTILNSKFLSFIILINQTPSNSTYVIMNSEICLGFPSHYAIKVSAFNSVKCTVGYNENAVVPVKKTERHSNKTFLRISDYDLGYFYIVLCVCIASNLRNSPILKYAMYLIRLRA